ncbi:hypothetical protein [Methylibium petroleiphilum]
MNTELFSEIRLMETAKLFSDSFEDPSKFAYHGTSTLFSREIESSGFRYPFEVIPPGDLLALADSLPEAEQALANTLRAAVRPTRLGFAPYSYAAVDYALTGGGQVVRLCRRAVDAGGRPSETIVARLETLAGAEPCVYAVDLSDPDDLNLAFDRIFIQSSSPVETSRIAAKMVLPSDFDVMKLRALQARKPLANAQYEPAALVAKLKRA